MLHVLIFFILHGNWQKNVLFCLPKIKALVHHIQQSYNYEASSKECWSWISKSCTILYSLLHDCFNIDLIKNSTALPEDNTLNHCINWFLFFFNFFFFQTDSVKENFDILENEMLQKWSITFQTIWDRGLESTCSITQNIWGMTVIEIRIVREDRILKISASIVDYSNVSIIQKWKKLLNM